MAKFRELTMPRVTFCKSFLKRQQQLEKDQQPHLWDVSKTTLPETFTTYTQAGMKDETLTFHISAFGKKIGAKWFHEFMHTELFHPGHKTFSDKKLPDSEGGTQGSAYGFDGAVGLARQKGGKNVAESSRNIENILYWSLAMYYDKWVWSTGKPEDRSSLTAPPVQARDINVAAKKPPKKTDKPQDPPKTDEPKEPPKTEAPPPPPKTEAPPPPPPKTESASEPLKTSAAPPPPPPPPPPPSSQVPPPPATTQIAPPVSSSASPPASGTVPPASAPQITAPISTQLPASRDPSMLSISTSISISSVISGSVSASTSLPSSCSNTLCTLPSSSITPTSSGAVPEETFESEPMNAGSMTGAEILTMAESIASEQIVAMGLWDQVLAEMGLPAELPNETIEGDPTASAGTGLPMATGGTGGAANGTWNMPVLRVRGGDANRGGVRERRMYDFAS
jgi:outer membrane biosynthesis protein TonB